MLQVLKISHLTPFGNDFFPVAWCVIMWYIIQTENKNSKDRFCARFKANQGKSLYNTTFETDIPIVHFMMLSQTSKMCLIIVFKCAFKSWSGSCETLPSLFHPPLMIIDDQPVTIKTSFIQLCSWLNPLSWTQARNSFCLLWRNTTVTEMTYLEHLSIMSVTHRFGEKHDRTNECNVKTFRLK